MGKEEVKTFSGDTAVYKSDPENATRAIDDKHFHRSNRIKKKKTFSAPHRKAKRDRQE